MVRKCTIFSPPICDGCEDGYHIDPNLNGCVECSPRCAASEEEVRKCTTEQDRICGPRHTVPTNPVLSKSIHLALKPLSGGHFMDSNIRLLYIRQRSSFECIVKLVGSVYDYCPLRNRKHVPCFYRVIETRVEVWKNEKCCGYTSRRRVFLQLLQALPNIHECFYNSIETRKTCQFSIYFRKHHDEKNEHNLLTLTIKM